MTLFSLIVVAFIIAIGLLLSVDWLVHISMVKENGKAYGWASYKRFVEEFDKVDWKPDELFSGSLFSKENYSHKDKIHANIIQFNNKGMIIYDPFSYLLTKFYIKKWIKQNRPINKVKEWR